MNTCKHYIHLLLLLCIGTLVSTSCETYELINGETPPLSLTTRSFTESDLPVNFFDHSISGIDSVIRTLKSVESETPFIEKFEKKNGIPLWDYTYIINSGEEVLYFVPLYKGKNSKEVKTLWFFHIRDGRMRYAPYKRNSPKMEYNEQRFVFDLLSYFVFGKDNASGLIFTPPQAQTRAWIDVTYCWPTAQMEGNVVTEIGITCVDRTYWIDDVVKWPSKPDWSDGGGGGETVLPGSGGGSGSGSGSDAIFRNDNLGEDTWEMLNELLDKIKEGCMGSNLFDAIKDELDGGRMKIQIVDEEYSSYNPDTGTLSLSVYMLESNVYLHELFHMYQTLLESKSDFLGSMMNREIEAHYMQFLFLQELDRTEGNYEEGFRGSPRWRAMKYLNEKYLDDHGNLQDNTMRDFVDTFISTQVVSIFRKDGYGDYPSFNENSSVFSNISTLTKDCN